MSRRVRPVLRHNFNAQRNAQGLPDWPHGKPLPRGLRNRDGYPRPLVPQDASRQDVEAIVTRGRELVDMRAYFVAATRLGYGKGSAQERRAIRKLEQTMRDLKLAKTILATLQEDPDLVQ